MKHLKNIFENNRKWSQGRISEDADFFKRLSKVQKPHYLWIGCSDSRVPANEITGLRPGELFVHRNVANIVIHTDLNCLSVLQFAVEVLGINHVIVCGHYGCGGVKAALEKEKHGLIDNWLRHVQDVQIKYKSRLAKINDRQKQLNKLCELNVLEQVNNLCLTTIIQNAWEKGKNVNIHGWIYSLENGRLKDLKVWDRRHFNKFLREKTPLSFGEGFE